MKKIIAIVLTLVMALSMVGAASATSYYMYHTENLIDGVFWWWVKDTSLFLDQENGTYTLMHKESAFGTQPAEDGSSNDKGSKTIIYKGTCDIAPSADGETAHLDVTITSVDSVMLEQHGKFVGRNVLNFAMVLDSECWTEDMEDIYGDTVEAWVANHQAPLGAVITVEDLALDYDDVTLCNRIVCGLEDIDLDITE